MSLTLLLDVSCLSLETGIQRSSVDKHVSSDDTHGSSLSQNIEKSCLSSTTDTHQSGEGTRLDPTSDVIQKTSRFTLDLNVIYNILPSEDIRLWLKSSSRVLALISLLRHSELLIGHAPVNTILKVSRDLTTLKDQNLSLARSLGVELSGDEVDKHEGDEEGDEDTKVAPDMGVGVSVVGLDKSITTDCSLSRYSSDD